MERRKPIIRTSGAQALNTLLAHVEWEAPGPMMTANGGRLSIVLDDAEAVDLAVALVEWCVEHAPALVHAARDAADEREAVERCAERR